jgi:SET domain-containing protein
LRTNQLRLFEVEDGRVIDGGIEGNSARWINHACMPNCIAEEAFVGSRPMNGLLDIGTDACRGPQIILLY